MNGRPNSRFMKLLAVSCAQNPPGTSSSVMSSVNGRAREYRPWQVCR